MSIDGATGGGLLDQSCNLTYTKPVSSQRASKIHRNE